MSNVCPICGNPTSSYMGNERKDKLCRKHALEFKEGKIIQCSKCGLWHKTDEKCKCEEKIEKQVINVPVSGIDITQPYTCLICGKDSNGYHFCKSCFKKFQSKEIILRITKCNQLEILEDVYFANNRCEDGHIVKSSEEQQIDNYLYTHKYQHIYEKSLAIKGQPKPLHPDWYLPEQDIYIEHLGVVGSKKYESIVNYKMPIYKSLGITLICTYPEDIKNLSEILENKITNCEKGKINFYKG